MPGPNKEISYPQEIVAIVGKPGPDRRTVYLATRRDGTVSHIALYTPRRRYKWFHQWRTSTASGEIKIIHYFSTKERTAPVPAWVPGRAERLEPLEIAYT